VSASADYTLRVWEVATGKEISVLRGHQSFALSASFSPDGTMLASSGGDHWLRLWDWREVSGAWTGKERPTPKGHPGWVLSVAFSPDGAIVASANVSTTSYWVAPGEIHLYSSDTGYPYALLRGHTKRVTSIAFSPDGKLLASGGADGTVRLWGTTNKGHELESTESPTLPPLQTSSFTEVWHRLNPDPKNPTPEHEVLICERNGSWKCSFYKQADPALGFENPPDSTTGSFSGQDVTSDWVCPSWFPSDVCDNLQFVASGVMSLNLSDGGEFAASQDLIIADHGGEKVLHLYWTEQGFYCPWYEDFDIALAANPFPTPFNGQDWPVMDCNQSP
jgi:hypothetical protein